MIDAGRGGQSIVVTRGGEMLLDAEVAFDFGSVEAARAYGQVLVNLPDDALGIAVFGFQGAEDQLLAFVRDLREVAKQQKAEDES